MVGMELLIVFDKCSSPDYGEEPRAVILEAREGIEPPFKALQASA